MTLKNSSFDEKIAEKVAIGYYHNIGEKVNDKWTPFPIRVSVGESETTVNVDIVVPVEKGGLYAGKKFHKGNALKRVFMALSGKRVSINIEEDEEGSK